MSEVPDYAAMLDKEFGSPTPPDAASDTTEPELVPTPPDTTVEVPEPSVEPTIDAGGMLRHADYTRKMQELARQRAEVTELLELKQQLDADPDMRERFAAAYEATQGQAPVAPTSDPSTAALNARIARLEATIAHQSFSTHAETVDGTALRIVREHGLTEKDAAAIIAKADKLGMVRPGTPPAVIDEQLRTVAASYVLPRAKADGQRELLGQIKDRGKGASPVVERPPSPEPEPDYGKMSDKAFTAQLIAEAERGRGKP